MSMSSIVPITKKIFISSENATNGKMKSMFKADINGIISKHKDVLYSTIRLLHCEIPISFYVINNTNNQMKINNTIYTFPVGNYNANTFIAEFNSLTGMSMTINNSTGILKITDGLEFNLNYDSDVTIGEILGYDSEMTSTNKSLILTYPCNFAATKNIYVKSQNLILDNYNNISGDITTIANIQNNVPMYKTIHYTNYSNNSQVIKNNILDSLELELRNEKNKLIDFNNMNSYLTFEIIEYIRVYPEKFKFKFDDIKKEIENNDNENNDNEKIKKDNN